MPIRIARSQRRAEKESLKARPMRRSDILFQDGRSMVARLKGFAAARFWGFATRWCTTMAEHLLELSRGRGDAGLLTPHGKYQLATSSQTFRDERDDAVDLRIFRTAPADFLKLLGTYRQH